MEAYSRKQDPVYGQVSEGGALRLAIHPAVDCGESNPERSRKLDLRESKTGPHPFDVFRSHEINLDVCRKISTRHIAHAIHAPIRLLLRGFLRPCKRHFLHSSGRRFAPHDRR